MRKAKNSNLMNYRTKPVTQLRKSSTQLQIKFPFALCSCNYTTVWLIKQHETYEFAHVVLFLSQGYESFEKCQSAFEIEYHFINCQRESVGCILHLAYGTVGSCCKY